MNKIPSFTINHDSLLRGIYVSRKDVTPSGDVITTFDIRLTEPNRQAAVSPEALHAMEHLAATYLRNHPTAASSVVYWGPMGCCTGCYLLMSGDYTSEQILPLVKETMEFVAEYEGEIPGATARDCGNYTFMDLPAARAAAKTFVDEVLTVIKPENLNYPA